MIRSLEEAILVRALVATTYRQEHGGLCIPMYGYIWLCKVMHGYVALSMVL